MTGGPPVRGTKLSAWRVPPIWNEAEQSRAAIAAPKNSAVQREQARLIAQTKRVLDAIAKDVREGLLETVGVNSRFAIDANRCAMILELPENVDAALVARAIDLENVEAWTNAEKKVCVGVAPWRTTKDVDQTVLATIKVVHVLLGLHASDDAAPKTFGQKLRGAIAEIMLLQKKSAAKINRGSS